MNKQELRQMKAAICKVLWEMWDPIGVNDVPEAFGEYDSYANGIQTLLLRDAADAEIVDHQLRLETVSMGLPGSSKERLAAVASVLRTVTIEPSSKMA